VPLEGFEPRNLQILSPFSRYLRGATAHYQVVFTDVPAVKAS
jgi:hypothetical protein